MAGVVEQRPARVRVPLVLDTSLIRPRLMSQLDATREPVILVTGPAGAGKTTAVAAWAQAHAESTAWLRVDDRDNDALAFWAAVLEALSGIEHLGVHQLQAPPRGPITSLLDALLEAIGDMPLTLVVDDVHALDDVELMESLADFAEVVPTTFRLVLISRTEPQIRQHQLRLDGRLREIGTSDLRLTVDETGILLKEQGLVADPELVTALHRRTEGWVAGVRLAALAMVDGRDPQALVPDFAGDDDAVSDYLAAEVLAHLPVAVNEFLDRTCGCTQLTVDLARALTGNQRSEQILEDLVRHNIFTVRLDHRREQYRYHDLLRTYLMTRVKRRDPGLSEDLHRTTAQWAMGKGDPLHAMEHFAMAGDIPALVDVARQWGVTLMLDGGGHRILTMLQQLPASGSGAEYLWLLGAACALEADDVVLADRYLHRVSARPPQDDAASRVLSAAVALARARYTKDVTPALGGLVEQCASPTGSPDIDLYAALHRGVGCLYVGRYADGLEALNRVAEVAEATGRAVLKMSALSFLAGAYASMNDFGNMRRCADAALQTAEERGWRQSQATAHAHMLTSWSWYLQSEPEAALEHAQAACAALRGHSEPDVELTSRTAVILAKDSLGLLTVEDVRSLMADLRRLSDATMSPAVIANTGPEVVRICLQMAERTWAREAAAITLETAPEPGEPVLAKALLLLDAGHPGPARRALDLIVGGEATCHVTMTKVTALLLAAVQDQRDGAEARSHALLCEALEIADPPRLSEPFASRPDVVDLLVRGEGRFGRHEDFAVRIVTLSRAGRGQEPTHRLTPAELAVLQQLPSLMSIRELAERRQVSVNTMKAQLRSIYRKLGVTGRREAVESGRRLHLL